MIHKNQVTDLFFDLDHTIYDFDKNSALTFQSVFEELDMKNLENFMFYFKPINEHYWDLFTQEKVSREELRYYRLYDTFNKMNVAVNDEQIHYIADYFIKNLSKNNHVFEGAHEALIYLSEKYRLHIITNGPERVQEQKLKSTKMDHFFETLTHSELLGIKKPNPEIFNFALQSAQANPSSSVMIGDNWKADIEGALNVGMHAVWFNQEGVQKPTNNVWEIKTLKELTKIF